LCLVDKFSLEGSRILIRPVTRKDLERLHIWWNDSRIMASVGYPDGLGISMANMLTCWKRWKNDPLRLMKIICLKPDLSPIGESNFHDYKPDEGIIQIGLKICNPELWGQGLGTETLRLMVDFAFSELKVNRVLINPAKTNARIIRVNEKVGFKPTGEDKGGLLMELRRREWLLKKI